MHAAAFLRAWTRDLRIGAVTKSSRQTIARIVASLPEPCARVVEYGPGDGVVTRHVLAHMPSSGTLLAIEQSTTFTTELRAIGDARLRIRVGDIRVDARSLRTLAGGPVDVVVSTAPLGLFSHAEREALVSATHAALRPGGRFIVCQYTPVILPAMRRHFRRVRVRFAPMNLPPYLVMVGER